MTSHEYQVGEMGKMLDKPITGSPTDWVYEEFKIPHVAVVNLGGEDVAEESILNVCQDAWAFIKSMTVQISTDHGF